MNKYINIVSKIYFPHTDKKKISKPVMLREIRAAINYGKILAAQDALKAVADSPTKAEAVGDIQISLKSAYQGVKSDLTLRIANLGLEEIMPPEENLAWNASKNNDTDLSLKNELILLSERN